ncbi:aldo/keto reductase [Entomomonas sp. E2T0]|uniref:aldo/keto reductase n=1 Tax=Entomomonas sp. E2T0 TaxID=2930213 RepID=UPI0022282136|nr:aldo/keto reductase [Entomomonas sp. E2T0]UYZ84710.1 aldo/keto reductase [Entomomonas sp. E2T0]
MSQFETQRSVKLADGTIIPAIGQGTWFMGENPSKEMDEISALQLGVELGMTLIDTAEMYANGGAELIVGKAIKHIRNKVFLVSKVYPHNAGKNSAIKACENSLKRLQTDYLDLYLLHWRGSIPLAETVEVMENLKASGKIKRWGVSNFDTDDMKQLWQITNGKNCAVNQVLYHLGSRGIEYDLIPWCKDHQMPIMAYCPIAQGGTLRKDLMNNKIVQDIAKAKQCTTAQLLLAWCIRNGNVIAIPKASNKTHVHENAQASTISFNQDELDLLDSIFTPPKHKIHLDIV